MTDLQSQIHQKSLNPLDITSKLIGVPLMVSDSMAQLIVDHVKTGSMFGFFDFEKESIVQVTDGVAIINVFGGLLNRSEYRTSYEEIKTSFRAALKDTSIQAILFRYDTGGGGVAGNFDLADEIYNSRDEKPIYSFVDENALSAGYSLASSASRVYAPRTGMVGSVGVRMMHVDYSAMDKKNGINVSIIYAGARKIDFDDSMPLSDEARIVGQTSVDKAYDIFTETVARNRGLTTDQVKATEAGIFENKDALSVGFIDEIMTFDQTIEQIKTNIRRR